jgi:Fanconi anemia group M protein
LNAYISEINIFVDYREKGSGVIKELIESGAKINLQKLEVGDFLLSDKCVVEYKKVPDFVDSIIDGRMMSQVKNLKNSYERPIIIIEGEENIYSQRKIHPNAIRGTMAMIAVSYGLPIIQTKDSKETAAFLSVIAKREQESGKTFNPHGSRKPMTLKEQQEYIVSALPSIGPSTAKRLLEKFGSVLNIMNASSEQLVVAENVGEKKAKEIQKVLTFKYS